MDWTKLPVTIMVVTYDRPDEIRRTIRALLNNLIYPGPVYWHLADDNSPGDYVQDVIADFPGLVWSYSVTDRQGWGKNVNTAMGRAFARSAYVFLIEDDYVALKPVDLKSGVLLLEHVPDLGLVRYDGIDGHVTMDLRLDELKVEGEDRVSYLRILPTTKHLNLYSNRPHLKAQRFHKNYGQYPEGLSLGITESVFAHRVKDNYKMVHIACLVDGIPRAFDHIGKSRQGSVLDPCGG